MQSDVDYVSAEELISPHTQVSIESVLQFKGSLVEPEQSVQTIVYPIDSLSHVVRIGQE